MEDAGEAPRPLAITGGMSGNRPRTREGRPPATDPAAGAISLNGIGRLPAAAAIGRAGLPQPASAVLMSPWADLAGTGDSLKTKADADPVITAEAVRVRARDYLGGADAADPAVSPVYARLSGLPPLLIQAGSHEVLLDDAIRLAARAAHDDVAVTLDVVPGVPHVFQAFAAVLDEGQAALTRAGTFVRQHTATANWQAGTSGMVREAVTRE
jgi:epsilon-lactone hydrolase